MKYVTVFALLLFTATAITFQSTAIAQDEAGDAMTEEQESNTVVIETKFGEIEIELLPEAAPKAVENFKGHVKAGYYDGVLFHRVISGFMIQGGDPNGTGTGGQSIWGGTFEDEIDKSSDLYSGQYNGYTRGTVAMANRGPNTNGSQFFIMHKDYGLQPNYTIFGKVVSGVETVDIIASQPTAGANRPTEDIKMTKVYVK